MDSDARRAELSRADAWTRTMIAETRGRGLQYIREYIDRIRSELPLEAGVRLVAATPGGIPGAWVMKDGWSRQHVIVYFHGGGFQFGSTVSHARAAADICAASAACGFIVDYRLAPEHQFPSAIIDCATAYAGVLASGLPPSRVAFVGDSAGGNLVVSTMLACRARGDPLPSCGVCLSPWVNLVCDGQTIALNKDIDPSGETDSLAENVSAYLGRAAPTEPLASPVYADLSRLPPLLIQVGTREILLDDARRLAERACRAGVQVTLEEWPDMIHNWQMLPHMLTDAVRANNRIGEFILGVWSGAASSLGDAKPGHIHR